MKRKILIFVILVSLIFSVGDYFFAMRDSYNKYLEGEYFFREKAVTVPVIDPDAWMSSLETWEMVKDIDFSDTRNMLLYGGNLEVYAYGPHDGVCTVYYGSNVVEDFPVSNLRFEGDDAEYFYGRKKYTYDEYISYVKSLSKDQLKSIRVSSEKMANFIDVQRHLFIMFGVELVFALILILLYRAELYDMFDLALLLAGLYGFFFEIITVIAYNF